MTLDPRAQRLLRMLSTSQTDEPAETVAARRQALEDLAALAGPATSAELHVADIVAPGPRGDLIMRRYRISQSERSALLFLHGGGWVAGSLGTHDAVCRRLACESGSQVFALDYSLAPEHKFPAALEDAYAALDWLFECSGALDLDRKRLAIGGDSAGATLAAAAASFPSSRDGPPVALQLLICPILDLEGKSASRQRFAEGYLLSERQFARDIQDYVPQGMDLKDPRLSPMYAEDLSATPKTLLHVAEYDPFHDEAIAYADRLERAGVVVERTLHAGMIHYFYALAGAIPYAATALTGIAHQLRGALAA